MDSPCSSIITGKIKLLKFSPNQLLDQLLSPHKVHWLKSSINLCPFQVCQIRFGSPILSRHFMRPISSFDSIYLWRLSVDFRKSINGLSAMVQEEMKLDAYSSALFIFGCARRKRIKILYWDKTGFAIWYKKLEEDLFPWPREFTDEVVLLSTKELQWILDGVEYWKIKPHVEKKYEKTC